MSFNNELDLYKRVERLVSAVFLVVSIMSDKHILRTKIESNSVDLMSYSSDLLNTLSYDKLTLIFKIESLAMQIASLIDVACISKIISPMNANILKREFDNFIASLEEIKREMGSISNLSKDFFLPTSEGSSMLQTNNNSEYKPLASGKEKVEMAQNVQKDKYSRSQSREKAILDIIRLKGEISIKDISRSVKGCSEKTIQRSLLALVENGVLKKNGERRWSRYSIS